MLVAKQVLFQIELFDLITSYQDGYYFELITIASAWKAQATELDVHAVVPTLDGKYFVSYSDMFPPPFEEYVATNSLLYPMHIAIWQCNLNQVKQWFKCNPSLCTAHALPCAAMYGHLELCKYINQFGTTSGSTWRAALDQAASRGHLQVVNYLLSIAPDDGIAPLDGPLAMDQAAKYGFNDIVVALHEHPLTSHCTSDAMDDAAAHGNLELVVFLHQNRHEGCTKSALLYAALNGYVHVVQYLVANSLTPRKAIENGVQTAMDTGHLDVVCYLLSVIESRINIISTLSLVGACENGHFNILRYFIEVQKFKNYSALQDAGIAAAKWGHLSILKYIQRKYPLLKFTPMALEEAKFQGHRQVIKYLSSNYCRHPSKSHKTTLTLNSFVLKTWQLKSTKQIASK